MTTAQVAKQLGVTTATVATYSRLRLLPVLAYTLPRLYDGDEVARFQRETFPLIRRGQGNKYPKPPKRRRK